MEPYDDTPRRLTQAGEFDLLAINTASPSNLPATTAVMAINELLQHILLQLSPENMTSLRTVSKTWNYIITSINRIYPIDNCICGLDHTGISAICNQYMPHYSSHITFKCNPVVFRSKSPNLSLGCIEGDGATAGRLINEFLFKETSECRKLPPGKLSRTREQFITDPPITIISIYDGISDLGVHVAMMFVPGGIRVGDLLDVLAKFAIEVDLVLYLRRSPRSTEAALASFARDVDFDWATAREKANAKAKAKATMDASTSDESP